MGKDSLYRMMDQVFDIYMLAKVERYDPSVIKREMSNKKIYLYDNGLVTALNYSLSEDRGKLLENLVYRHLREKTTEIYFGRNGWECDFVAFFHDREPLLVQVTARLDNNNLAREVKGLESIRKLTRTGQALLLVESIDPELDVPEWIRVAIVTDWLLEGP